MAGGNLSFISSRRIPLLQTTDFEVSRQCYGKFDDAMMQDGGRTSIE
jgi:hypothetical protein